MEVPWGPFCTATGLSHAKEVGDLLFCPHCGLKNPDHVGESSVATTANHKPNKTSSATATNVGLSSSPAPQAPPGQKVFAFCPQVSERHRQKVIRQPKPKNRPNAGSKAFPFRGPPSSIASSPPPAEQEDEPPPQQVLSAVTKLSVLAQQEVRVHVQLYEQWLQKKGAKWTYRKPTGLSPGLFAIRICDYNSESLAIVDYVLRKLDRSDFVDPRDLDNYFDHLLIAGFTDEHHEPIEVSGSHTVAKCVTEGLMAFRKNVKSNEYNVSIVIQYSKDANPNPRRQRFTPSIERSPGFYLPYGLNCRIAPLASAQSRDPLTATREILPRDVFDPIANALVQPKISESRGSIKVEKSSKSSISSKPLVVQSIDLTSDTEESAEEGSQVAIPLRMYGEPDLPSLDDLVRVKQENPSVPRVDASAEIKPDISPIELDTLPTENKQNNVSKKRIRSVELPPPSDRVTRNRGKRT